MTPRPGIILMVAPLLSGDDTAEKVRVFCSPTASVGINRMAASPAAFSSVEATAGAALELWASGAHGRVAGAEEGCGCGGVTCSVAEMPLPPAVVVLRKSGVSLTVATGDLASVAIMSGVMRSTVWPLASVVMEDGGRRRTSLPWMRRLVAVMGIPAAPGPFIPNCPVMETCGEEIKPLTNRQEVGSVFSLHLASQCNNVKADQSVALSFASFRITEAKTKKWLLDLLRHYISQSSIHCKLLHKLKKMYRIHTGRDEAEWFFCIYFL